MRTRRNAARLLALAAAVTGLAVWGIPGAAAADLVLTSTNAADGNAVVAFARGANGHLTPFDTAATGGRGTGAALASQGALALAGDSGRRVFTVNAGSHSVSELAVRPGGLHLLSTVDSGGPRPVSLTVHGNRLYVLDHGGEHVPGAITGFRIGSGGLTPIPGSTRPLGSSAGDPAEIAFSPDGHLLAVTEKAANAIDTYTVDGAGRAHGPTVQPSSGETPYGFAFDPFGHLVVSDAAGGAPNAGALSSYGASDAGLLTPISPLVADNQTAPCWVVVTGDGRTAFTSNTGSDSISAYAVSPGGQLRLLRARGGETPSGSTPIDIALAGGDGFLYALDSASHRITGFRVGDGGRLIRLPGGPDGLSPAAAGLVAR